MDDPISPPRRSTRRRLLQFVGASILLALVAETVRVYALTNQHTVLRGRLYRSAQLSPDELTQLIKDKKIRTVINLRGTSPDTDWYQEESRVTHAAGVNQEDISLSAKRLPAPNEIRRLVEVLDRTDYPVVVHCQRGADRTGLVSTVALLLHTNATLDAARHQLWPRYGHVRFGRTAVIDRFFDFYEGWLQSTGQTHTPERFRQWADHEYCPGPYRARLSLIGDSPPEVAANRGFNLTIRAVNVALEPWVFCTGATGGVQLRYYLYSSAGVKLYAGRAGRLARTVNPNESIDLVAGFPPLPTPGRYLVNVDLLDTQPIDKLDSDFSQYGSEPIVFDLFVK